MFIQVLTFRFIVIFAQTFGRLRQFVFGVFKKIPNTYLRELKSIEICQKHKY